MKAVRVGYVFTLSLLIVLAGQFLLTYYYKPPTPPATPVMPEYSYEDKYDGYGDFDKDLPIDPPYYPEPTDDYLYPTTPPAPVISISPTQTPVDLGIDIDPPVQQPITFPPDGISSPVQSIPILGKVQKNLAVSQGRNMMWVGATQGYDEDMEKYWDEMDTYDDKLKIYAKDEFIPYLKTLTMIGMVALAVITIIGIVLARIGFTTVGSAYALTGVWGVILLMPASLLLTLNVTASLVPPDQEAYMYLDPLIGGVGWTAGILAVILSLAGIFLLENLSLKLPGRSHPTTATPTVI